MSERFDCPKCQSSQKAIESPSDGFGYFISNVAVEEIENMFFLPMFALRDWLNGKTKLPHHESKTPKVARCQACGHVEG